MRILNSVFYHGLIIPISRLPFPVLYFFSDTVFFLLFYLVGYRRSTVRCNLEKSFPQKTTEELNHIEKKFFRHLMDVIFESFKLFTLSKKSVKLRVIYSNPEVVDRFYEEGRSVIIAVGHYNNWELIAASMDMPLKHQTIGIYQKLSSPYFDQKMIETRSRFGMRLISTKEVKEVFVKEKANLTATIFAIDQSPSPQSSPYWMNFLNQDTAVQFGTEKYAKEYNYPVVFGHMRKVKRGFYNIEFQVIAEEPSSTQAGEITERVTRILEKEIVAVPEFWLWSHKRWKLKR